MALKKWNNSRFWLWRILVHSFTYVSQVKKLPNCSKIKNWLQFAFSTLFSIITPLYIDNVFLRKCVTACVCYGFFTLNCVVLDPPFSILLSLNLSFDPPKTSKHIFHGRRIMTISAYSKNPERNPSSETKPKHTKWRSRQKKFKTWPS